MVKIMENQPYEQMDDLGGKLPPHPYSWVGNTHMKFLQAAGIGFQAAGIGFQAAGIGVLPGGTH